MLNMGSHTDYQLIDFGNGRKLERFGGVLLDRPSPAADRFSVADAAAWRKAARFEKGTSQTGQWSGERLPESWLIEVSTLRLELRPTDFGHLGIFPEQAANWNWLRDLPLANQNVLNLFAYTGGSTLAAALAGAHVTHVDAAKNIVAWARANAAHNALAEYPIRWIVEDALKFTQREVRRGRKYAGIILDPPSYGHGPGGEAWKLESDLIKLLSACRSLLDQRPQFVLFTCHTPGITPSIAAELLAEYLPAPRGATREQNEMQLVSSHGEKLPSGVFARWSVSP
jgi:23S rRNA (cytosine1962-C5)-methyltransferase